MSGQVRQMRHDLLLQHSIFNGDKPNYGTIDEQNVVVLSLYYIVDICKSNADVEFNKSNINAILKQQLLLLQQHQQHQYFHNHDFPHGHEYYVFLDQHHCFSQ
jgi:hypothetical protein